MGYDMYIVNPDPAYEKAEKEFNDLIRQPGNSWSSPEVQEARRKADEVEHLGYFRANIWGMGLLREMMENFGMLKIDGDYPWQFPSPEQFGLGEEVWSLSEEEQAADPRYQAFSKASDAVRDFDTGPGGIPVWKLGSNDGWLVTPAECEGALKQWDDSSEELSPASHSLDHIEYFDDWLKFLETAKDRGGFRVW